MFHLRPLHCSARPAPVAGLPPVFLPSQKRQGLPLGAAVEHLIGPESPLSHALSCKQACPELLFRI